MPSYLDGGGPFSRLADVLGTSEQTVARRYRRLREAGVVRVVGQLDSQRLGQSDWVIRIRCAGTPPAVSTALARRTDTAWVQLTSGGTESSPPSTPTTDVTGRRSFWSASKPAASSAWRPTASSTCSPPALPDPGIVGVAPRRGRPASSDPPSAPRPTRSCRSDWPVIHTLADDGRPPIGNWPTGPTGTSRPCGAAWTSSPGPGSCTSTSTRSDALGVRTRAILWMSVAPRHLDDVGEALAARAELPFAAATTGATTWWPRWAAGTTKRFSST